MKLKINEKYVECNFWSFMKMNFLTQLALVGMVYGAILVLALIFGILGLLLI